MALQTLGEAWQAAWPAALSAGALTVVATRRVLAYLHRKQIFDHPNERSSHSLPTPRGGGLATTPVMALMLIALGVHHAIAAAIALGLGALALMAVSWWDDRHSLPVWPRFAVHALMIGLFLATLPESQLVFQGALPFWPDRAVTLLAGLWFVNLYNFMDGIDGITGVETVSLGLGLGLIGTMTLAVDFLPLGAVIAAVGAAFLIFNWHPARVFLGDSGSVPFGFVLGGLLMLLAARGQLAAALILPAYYLADATLTLLRRALDGERIWQAHRKHFYQRAVQGGKSHDRVALVIAGGNAVLIGFAALAASGEVLLGTAGAVATTASLLAMLQHWSRGKPS